MSPEKGKISKCCGEDLIIRSDPGGTGYYECLKCKNACDSAIDCADCFPHRYKNKHDGQTVPICNVHFYQYKERPLEYTADLSLAEELNKIPPEKSPEVLKKQNSFTEIYDILINLNPPAVVNRADYIHYSNRCYTATQKIIKLLVA